MWLFEWAPLKVSHHPAKFGGHTLCGSGDMFLVVEGQNSTCSRLNLPLLFIFIMPGMPCLHTKFQDVDTLIYQFVPWRESGTGHTCRQQQLTEITAKTFTSTSRNSDEKEKEKKKKTTTREVIEKLFALHANAVITWI